MSHKSSSTQVALGGLSAALCLVVMLGTVLVPFATYALPALAGILLIPIALELGSSTAYVTYFAVSFLSLLIIPDREAALMFIAFLGYYPVLKFRLDKFKLKTLRVLSKFLIFNVAILGGYFIVINLFGLTYLLEDIEGSLGFVLLLISNLSFPMYEKALTNLTALYLFKIRAKLFRK